jgi:hypothetical protein
MTKKPRLRRGFSPFLRREKSLPSHLDFSDSDYAYVFALLWALDFKAYPAVSGGEQGIILTESHVLARVELGATLPHKDIAGLDQLATEAFDT